MKYQGEMKYLYLTLEYYDFPLNKQDSFNEEKTVEIIQVFGEEDEDKEK